MCSAWHLDWPSAFCVFVSPESQRIPQVPHWTLWRLASENWRSRSSEETDTSVWFAWYERIRMLDAPVSKPSVPKWDRNECALMRPRRDCVAQSWSLRLQWLCKSHLYSDISRHRFVASEADKIDHALWHSTSFSKLQPTHIFIFILPCAHISHLPMMLLL